MIFILSEHSEERITVVSVGSPISFCFLRIFITLQLDVGHVRVLLEPKRCVNSFHIQLKKKKKKGKWSFILLLAVLHRCGSPEQPFSPFSRATFFRIQWNLF